MFGLMPLHGHNVWLHLGTAAVAAYYGWSMHAGERRGLTGDRRKGMPAQVERERRHSVPDRRRAPFPT